MRIKLQERAATAGNRVSFISQSRTRQSVCFCLIHINNCLTCQKGCAWALHWTRGRKHLERVESQRVPSPQRYHIVLFSFLLFMLNLFSPYRSSLVSASRLSKIISQIGELAGFFQWDCRMNWIWLDGDTISEVIFLCQGCKNTNVFFLQWQINFAQRPVKLRGQSEKMTGLVGLEDLSPRKYYIFTTSLNRSNWFTRCENLGDASVVIREEHM